MFLHRIRRLCQVLPFGLAAACALGFGAYHRTPLSEPGSTNLPAALLTNAALQRISEGVYGLGLVQLDKNTRTIRFPSVVNMSEGLVEYALVHASGKVHESVLKTDADPLHIHLAKLLLAMNESASPPPAAGTPSEPAGARIRIWVSWKSGAAEQRVPIENLVSNTLTRAQMTRGDWVYNGSRVVDGIFLAQRDGSIAAIIADPDALVNSPRPGRDDDDIWKANGSLVPPVGTPVDVSIELGAGAPTASQSPPK